MLVSLKTILSVINKRRVNNTKTNTTGGYRTWRLSAGLQATEWSDTEGVSRFDQANTAFHKTYTRFNKHPGRSRKRKWKKLMACLLNCDITGENWRTRVDRVSNAEQLLKSEKNNRCPLNTLHKVYNFYLVIFENNPCIFRGRKCIRMHKSD